MEPKAHGDFQRVMTIQVLDGLIHAICELYIDDCFVFGSTGNEYLTRLEQVLQRFAEKDIILIEGVMESNTLGISSRLKESRAPEMNT